VAKSAHLPGSLESDHAAVVLFLAGEIGFVGAMDRRAERRRLGGTGLRGRAGDQGMAKGQWW
jgi:hypothetical protein